MKPSVFLPSAAIVLIVFAQAASAQHFLGGTAGRDLTDSDWSMLESARTKALDQGADRTAVTWKNPETTHWGTITPVSTEQARGTTCRRLVFETHAGKRSGKSRFTYCKVDGQWKAAE